MLLGIENKSKNKMAGGKEKVEGMHKGRLMFPLSPSPVHRKDIVRKQSIEGG